MTIKSEVENGEDLKNFIKNHKDCINLSSVKHEDINDNEMYYGSKHIGYYEKYKKSGIFIKDITLITDDFINKMFT